MGAYSPVRVLFATQTIPQLRQYTTFQPVGRHLLTNLDVIFTAKIRVSANFIDFVYIREWQQRGLRDSLVVPVLGCLSVWHLYTKRISHPHFMDVMFFVPLLIYGLQHLYIKRAEDQSKSFCALRSRRSQLYRSPYLSMCK